MKKNGFTLVELLAVLVILAILGGLAAPNIINLMQSGKEEAFIEDAKEMVSSATYMYKIAYARDFIEDNNFLTDGDGYKILMSNINGNVPDTDPYGYKYKQNDSYIKFQEPSETNINGKRSIKAYFKSCLEDEDGNIKKCHCIDVTDSDKDATDIKNSDIVDCN